MKPKPYNIVAGHSHTQSGIPDITRKLSCSKDRDDFKRYIIENSAVFKEYTKKERILYKNNYYIMKIKCVNTGFFITTESTDLVASNGCKEITLPVPIDNVESLDMRDISLDFVKKLKTYIELKKISKI